MSSSGDVISTPRLNSAVCSVVERVVTGTSRSCPADRLLREELKSQRGLTREEGALAARAVFAWFRWWGWLDERKPFRQEIERASRMAESFAREPDKFTDADLIARAVPEWTRSEVELTAAWARSLQREPNVWLRCKAGLGRAVASKLGDCVAFGEGPLADALEYFGDKDLFRTAAFQAGEFEIQDISSQAVGLICGAQPGEVWWDACAGEGGKLLHLAELMRNKGLLWASDRAAWRLKLLRRRAARAKVFNYRTAPWDGNARLPTKTKFDGVLVDAPCSGIGTWQRNPHARWTTTNDDVKELAELQRQLLANAVPAVKPGGKLIYAVCTLARSETRDVAEHFGRTFVEFEPLAVQDPLHTASGLAAQVWCWPQDFGGSGMFVAAWSRGSGAKSP